jgi:hypothetical protein
MTDTLAALIVLRFKDHTDGPVSITFNTEGLRSDITESCVGMSMEYEFNLVNICDTLTGTLVAFVEVSQSPSGRPLTIKRLDALCDELATDVGATSSSFNMLKGGA